MIGDPGVDLLFDNAVYTRGAMTLQALRNEVGDDTFWAIVRGWAASKSGGNGTTEQFIALAERIAGRQLDQVFDTWLFTAGKPAPSAVSGSGGAAAPLTQPTRERASAWLDGLRTRLAHGRY